MNAPREKHQSRRRRDGFLRRLVEPPAMIRDPDTRRRLRLLALMLLPMLVLLLLVLTVVHPLIRGGAYNPLLDPEFHIGAVCICTILLALFLVRTRWYRWSAFFPTLGFIAAGVTMLYITEADVIRRSIPFFPIVLGLLLGAIFLDIHRMAALAMLSVLGMGMAVVAFPPLPGEQHLRSLAFLIIVAFLSTAMAWMRGRDRDEIRREFRERRAIEANLKSALKSAEAASGAKSQFLANMSHEIRTPMNAVIGMTTLLLETKLDGEQRKYADTIEHSGRNLLTLINDILDFSRIEAGKVELEEQQFYIWRCIEESVELSAREAVRRGNTFDVQVPPDMPGTVFGDMTRLRQILVNLISNAVKFTQNGVIRIGVRCPGDCPPSAKDRVHFEFTIRDNGIGIPTDRLDTIFELFAQADASTTRKYGGTGLGLAICKRLVQLMGGEISVVSSPGQGATFRFTAALRPVPAEEEEAKVEPRLKTRMDPALAERLPLRILLAEDNVDNQLLALRVLNKFGYTADTAANGLEALEAVGRKSYDIILMDVQMPEMDGLEAARTIVADPDPERPRIIAMTAGAAESDRDACFAAGMDDYISKPFDPEQIRLMLEKWGRPES